MFTIANRLEPTSWSIILRLHVILSCLNRIPGIWSYRQLLHPLPFDRYNLSIYWRCQRNCSLYSINAFEKR